MTESMTAFGDGTRDGDTATTCNDPIDQPAGNVVAASTVIVGG